MGRVRPLAGKQQTQQQLPSTTAVGSSVASASSPTRPDGKLRRALPENSRAGKAMF